MKNSKVFIQPDNRDNEGNQKSNSAGARFKVLIFICMMTCISLMSSCIIFVRHHH